MFNRLWINRFNQRFARWHRVAWFAQNCLVGIELLGNRNIITPKEEYLRYSSFLLASSQKPTHTHFSALPPTPTSSLPHSHSPPLSLASPTPTLSFPLTATLSNLSHTHFITLTPHTLAPKKLLAPVFLRKKAPRRKVRCFNVSYLPKLFCTDLCDSFIPPFNIF